jgi:citrate synthase
MGDLFDITDDIRALADEVEENSQIASNLYQEYEVKQGLRDVDGKGVLAGLTNISTITSKKLVDGKLVPADGKLCYRGIDIREIVGGFLKDDRLGYEEVAYLLLFGVLPDKDELAKFKVLLAERASLPTNFIRDVIMKASSKDIMNAMSRSVLTLSSYDENSDDTSIANVLNQSLMLISVFPRLAVYAYHAYNHYTNNASMYIHYPDPTNSTAENVLMMLRADKSFTKTEAKVLDMSLVLHMEHGGGNNSTFTTHVITSSGTDTYSAISAALGSLKGPKHGGANIRVAGMMNDMKQHITDYHSEAQVRDYLEKILDKQVYDKRGLIYGMGHAVYSISDPRALLFKGLVKDLAKDKGREDEYRLYELVEKLAPSVIAEKRKIYKGVSPNVDFYSGFVYSMLDLPEELYTPMFAIARIVGWSAHRLEELLNSNKIIRPAYDSVSKPLHYDPLDNRD